MRVDELLAPPGAGRRGSKMDKYHHRKPSADEFRDLMRRGGMQMNDFLFLTGRRGAALKPFLDGEPNPKNSTYAPTMGDVLILEMIARNPALLAEAIAIANEYSLDEQGRAGGGRQERSEAVVTYTRGRKP